MEHKMAMIANAAKQLVGNVPDARKAAQEVFKQLADKFSIDEEDIVGALVALMDYNPDTKKPVQTPIELADMLKDILDGRKIYPDDFTDEYSPDPELLEKLSNTVAEKNSRIKALLDKPSYRDIADDLRATLIDESPTQIINNLSKADPTPDKRYVVFLVKELINGNFNYPLDLQDAHRSIKKHLQWEQMGILDPNEIGVNALTSFQHLKDIADSHDDPETLHMTQTPKFDNVDSTIKWIIKNVPISKDDFLEYKSLHPKATPETYMGLKFGQSLRAFLQYLGNIGYHTKKGEVMHPGAIRHREEFEPKLEPSDVPGRTPFDKSSLDNLYRDAFIFFSYAPGLRGKPPTNLENAMKQPPTAAAKELEMERPQGSDTFERNRIYYLSRLKGLYFAPVDDPTKSDEQKWDTIKRWLHSMELKGMNQGVMSKDPYTMGKKSRSYQNYIGAKKFYDDAEKRRKPGPTTGPSEDPLKGMKMEDVKKSTGPAKGLRIYESQHEALGAMFATEMTLEHRKMVNEAHKKGIWLGPTEGYEIPLSSRSKEAESGYDTVASQKQADIIPEDIPFTKKAAEIDDMMEAVMAQQESPEGKGVQKQNVGSIEGKTDNETDKLKSVSSKNTEGGLGTPGSEPKEKGQTKDAGIECPDGKGVQSCSVGKI